MQGSLFYDCPMWPIKGSDWWLAYAEDGTHAAFAGLSVKKPGVGYLCRAGVLPQFRGEGLQRELIDARVKLAKRKGLTSVVSDTAAWNTHSMNNLIDAGFRAYTPEEPWGVKGAVHWRKEIA